MNEMIQEAVLDSVILVDEEALFAEYDVLMSLADVYTKSVLIRENSECVFDGVSIFQEADDNADAANPKDGKLKKLWGSSERGAESGIKGWFFKILRWIKKTFGIIKKKLQHLVRVVKNRKDEEQLITLNFKLDAVVRASESLVDASEHLDAFFESKGDDKVSGKKLNTFIAAAEKAMAKAQHPYKEMLNECDAAMKTINENIDKAQNAYDTAFKKAEAFGREIGLDAYKPKGQQKLQDDKTHSFNIENRSLLARYAGILNRFSVVTADISKALGIRKNENKIKENQRMEWEYNDTSGWD